MRFPKIKVFSVLLVLSALVSGCDVSPIYLKEGVSKDNVFEVWHEERHIWLGFDDGWGNNQEIAIYLTEETSQQSHEYLDEWVQVMVRSFTRWCDLPDDFREIGQQFVLITVDCHPRPYFTDEDVDVVGQRLQERWIRRNCIKC